MSMNTAPTKKLALVRNDVKRLGVRTGVQTGAIVLPPLRATRTADSVSSAPVLPIHSVG
jgi:hypothetical protein